MVRATIDRVSLLKILNDLGTVRGAVNGGEAMQAVRTAHNAGEPDHPIRLEIPPVEGSGHAV